jgi:acetyltransferase-like isoleucine patch superfamily enzyme
MSDYRSLRFGWFREVPALSGRNIDHGHRRATGIWKRPLNRAQAAPQRLEAQPSARPDGLPPDTGGQERSPETGGNGVLPETGGRAEPLHRPFQRLGRLLDSGGLVSAALRVSVCRTLYHSARHGGWCIVLRGTRLKLRRGAQISIPRGSRLILGTRHVAATPCSVYLRQNARLSVRGSVEIVRGTRILVSDGGHLEIGPESYINYDSTVSCFDHITIGSKCAISWNTNILDANTHELIVAGVPRPRSRPVVIGDHVWIGTGVTILSGVTIGDGAVVAAGSVVTSDVPGRVLVAGNPARVVREDVSWVQ